MHFHRVPLPRWPHWLAAGVAVILVFEASYALRGNEMTYRQAREFLAQHTKLIELTDDEGARVAICPQWQGRVMTSTCGGLDGPSFGFINQEYIGIYVNGHRKTQSHIHTGGVGFHRIIDKFLKTGKSNNIFKLFSHLRS